ncbi:FUSC family protein [Sphingomonas nostoxanthinifaciens]|uniref:FUSC family protein n=1 Tax=Sphingomonas nostoxanthinifaciens TaxID=2872652 RepID=UPI001CC217CB|nr:FUSC family protein [Sphingomonas nostoxanthinifaciens]UAK23097.1 FUSC family protein [Sphingomonas nostoxanthinifaciens]
MASGRPSSEKRAVGRNRLVDAFFSLKTLAAAFLAYYISLRIGLERPYWSVITCYIVAQPLAGALLSKGLFRLIGTVIGAGMAVVLVPNLVNTPELLSMALAVWLGTCTYVAALDRTPRSYISLLAGYSAVIVGFPSVDTPGEIFIVALSRVQEIGIGIVCVSLVHALLFPRPVWRQVRDRLDLILADAEAWSLDALATPAAPDAVLWRDRRRLANDLHDLHLLSVHLPYDMASTVIEPASLRSVEMQLGRLLPLASAVEDRIEALRQEDAYTSPLTDLIEDVRDWVAREAPGDGLPLIERACALEPTLDAPEGWAQLVRLSLLDRLADLIETHATVRQLRNRLVRGASSGSPTASIRPRDAARRVLHRDHWMALRAAATTSLTVIAGCTFWIVTAWPDGATAVVSAAIICALFSHLDAPLRAARRVFHGTIGAAIVAGLCAFVLMPRATDFVILCLVLSPFLFLLGWLLARPNRAPYGIGAVLAFPGLAGLNATYGSMFATFANQAIAQVLGSLVACLMLGAVRATGAEGTARRLARAGWRELARKTETRSEPDTPAWISRTLDRMVLLSPHLANLAEATSEERDRLRDLRIGMALDELQRVGMSVGERQVRRNDLLKNRLRDRFVSAQRIGVLETDPALQRLLDRTLASANALPPSAGKRSLLLALVGLSRNLSPLA